MQNLPAFAPRPAVYSILASLGPNSRAQVRCYEAGAPLFAALSREFPGDFARWEFHPAGDADEEGVCTIKNVGLGGYVGIGEDGALVVASDLADAIAFRVQPAEDGSVLLKHSAEDKVWSVKGEGIRVNVVMQAADVSFKQQFTQVAIED